MRIVTLLPSATEIVCALGLRKHLVGVSHSCDYPSSVAGLPKMTSTRVPYTQSSETIDGFVREHLAENAALYDLDLDQLRAARPDFIISQALCDVCAVSTGDVLAALSSLPSRPQLIDLEPNTLDDVFTDILNVGETLGVGNMARELVASLCERRSRAYAISQSITEKPGVVFLEWLFPPFNGGHWTPELIELAGGIDLIGNPGLPSATRQWPDIIATQPEVLYIACCGFSIDRAVQDVRKLMPTSIWQQLPAVRNGRVYVTDGNAYFSSPGPRLLDGVEIMAHALHPDHHPGLWLQAPSRP